MLPSEEFFAFPIAHRPLPNWQCRSCGSDWPCEPARAELAAAVTADLVGHMGHLALVAAHDLGLDSQPAKLYKRFLGWLAGDGPCIRCGHAGHQVLRGLPLRLFPCRFDDGLPPMAGGGAR